MCEPSGREMSRVSAVVLGVPRAWDVVKRRDFPDAPSSHPKRGDSHLGEGVPGASAGE